MRRKSNISGGSSLGKLFVRHESYKMNKIYVPLCGAG